MKLILEIGLIIGIILFCLIIYLTIKRRRIERKLDEAWAKAQANEYMLKRDDRTFKGNGGEEPLSVSIAYPKFFAKRYSTNLLVHLFLAEVYSVVIDEVKSTLGNDAV